MNDDQLQQLNMVLSDLTTAQQLTNAALAALYKAHPDRAALATAYDEARRLYASETTDGVIGKHSVTLVNSIEIALGRWPKPQPTQG